MHRITFGTSGWRGILGEDFTFDSVKTVTQAIADHLKETGAGDKGVVVGFDTRFMGKEFAHEVARVLAASGIKSFLCHRDTPTPVISLEILRRGAGGGLNVTASHNPYPYNGIKVFSSWGGPAPAEATRDMARRANEMRGEVCYREMPLDQAFKAGLVEEIDPREYYFSRLRERVNLPAIAASGMRIAVNPLHGTARGYLDALLERAGVDIVRFNDRSDPYFGGLPPEPSRNHIHDFMTLVAECGDIQLGLATDGDGDRFGIVDRDGDFIEPNAVLALLYDYLIRRKGEQGNAARSVATSHFLDAVAAHHGFEVFETPVGFDPICDYIANDRILIGGEESGGLSIQGHVPEKDGILACLLVAEMVAVEGASLKELLADLFQRVGEFHTRREDVRLTPELVEPLGVKLKAPPESLGTRKINLVVTVDGCKMVLEDGSWALFRKGKTEPVVRIYAEARTDTALEEVMEAAKRFVLGG